MLLTSFRKNTDNFHFITGPATTPYPSVFWNRPDSPGRRGGPRIVRPGMLGIAALQFLLDFGVGPFPEAAQILRHLNRSLRRRQQVQRHRQSARGDARGIGQPEQFLQLHRQHRRFARRVPQAQPRTAGHCADESAPVRSAAPAADDPVAPGAPPPDPAAASARAG